MNTSLDKLMLEAFAQLQMERSGWLSRFATTEVPGAYKNGTRISKIDEEPGDAHKIGALGTVLGSLWQPARGVAYFIEWDDMPKFAVIAMAWKIGALA